MNKPEPLYKTVYHSIRTKIENGELSAGVRGPSEAEVIQQFDVSRITAIRALNELEDDGYIKRIPKVGSTVLGQAQWERVKSVPKGLKTIPLIFPYVRDELPQLLSGVQKIALENGYYVTPLDTGRSPEREGEILRSFIDMPVDGIIAYPLECYQNLSSYNAVIKAGISVVTIDKRLWGIDIPCVTTDNRTAMHEITKWLVNEMGHTRVAFCCGSLLIDNERYRYKGYLQALTECGLDFNQQYVGEVLRREDIHRIMSSKDIQLRIAAFLKQLMELSQRPTAIVCAHDTLALLVKQQLWNLNISVPGDVSVTGFDNLKICTLTNPPLTTMAQDFNGIGQAAVQALLQLIQGETVQPLRLFDGSLIERMSVRNLRQKIAR